MLTSLSTWIIVCLAYLLSVEGMSVSRRLQLREEVRKMFVHGYEGYMTHAYPADELRPLTCAPLHRDPDPFNSGVNDIHANASITLLDVLSTLPLIHPEAFPHAVQLVATQVSFDQDVKVQVFEMTIRAMGALLSTYQLLDRLPDDETLQAKQLGLTEGKVDVKKYRGRVLELALDLGKRLLPAFSTPTGIPYSRVNLKRGVEKGESTDTCTAGAGSLVLEFAVLSRLTHDERFETVANRAYLAIWNRRSPHNLVGNTIGVGHGHWLAPGQSGTGAGIDSFYEYGIKAAILLGDDSYLDIFHDSYAAVQTHVRTDDGFIYRSVQLRILQPANPSTIDSLSAFFPGMQVLAGDIESAIKSHLVFWNLWRNYDALPESWDWENRQIQWAGWPGRPEFVESTYYLYQATRDPFYLRVGERVLSDMVRRTKTACGFATLKNVETDELEDRMESFVLSETLKYLYLLFDDQNSTPLSNRVFSTEGHPLFLPYNLTKPSSAIRRELHRGENLVCPVYEPPVLGGGLVVGIERRPDYEYARHLVFGSGVDGRAAEDQHRTQWWEGGFCPIPSVPKFSVDIYLFPLDSSDQSPPPLEDTSPSSDKVSRDEHTGDFTIHKVDGLRLTVRWRLDNKGYDVSSIGPHRVRAGQQVIVRDPSMSGYLPIPSTPSTYSHSPAEVLMRFSTASTSGERQVILHAIGATAIFGRDFSRSGPGGWTLHGGHTKLLRPEKSNLDACRPLKTIPTPAILLIQRGKCTFLTKLHHAVKAGAAGVIVVGYPPSSNADTQQVLGVGIGIDDELGLIRPSAENEPQHILDTVKDAGMIYIDHLVGDALSTVLDLGIVQVDVELMGDANGQNGHAKSGEIVKGQASGSAFGRRSEERQGRLALGPWEIWNLKILEP
ncbi:glycoside hydrolase [Naematelia encephala]|uniref:alpha-1,2-Mannosidase n=1 Tax=Naematelia encephala TaxID=71784 RepID=A0A1Y2BBU1_9TREE|nr:glycoside hydrolase [Naematelia encephala]